jgi:hypothetical protein
LARGIRIVEYQSDNLANCKVIIDMLFCFKSKRELLGPILDQKKKKKSDKEPTVSQ